MTRRRRYAQVGLGGRSEMFRTAVLETFKETSELVGVCDRNEGRVRLAVDHARERGVAVPGYASEDFDRMIGETKPDCVIVTVMDCFHDEYICRAMELGCDAISEKPMTTDAQKCQRIIDTRNATGRSVTVTFNYRYAPPRSQVKDLLLSGVIGDVLSVDFHWFLNIHHGADYYRRWHRNKVNSGGLIVHKATHHFDLVNWWLGDVPSRVFASGHRRFYVPAIAEEVYGLSKRGERCHGCPEAERCPFRLDMAGNKHLRALYLECEQYDGYYRDRCVFSESIDIEDSMNLVVDYAAGVKMSYSLNSFSPWEGYIVTFNGTKGRLEHKCEESVYVNADGSVPGALKKEGTWIRVYPHREPAYAVDLWTGEGGHGGADPVMLTYIFDPAGQPEDRLLRAADHRSGAWSILTGVAANRSMASGEPVKVSDLVAGVELPDYP